MSSALEKANWAQGSVCRSSRFFAFRFTTGDAGHCRLRRKNPLAVQSSFHSATHDDHIKSGAATTGDTSTTGARAMRIPRIRSTIRSMMVLVVLIGITLGVTVSIQRLKSGRNDDGFINDPSNFPWPDDDGFINDPMHPRRRESRPSPPPTPGQRVLIFVRRSSWREDRQVAAVRAGNHRAVLERVFQCSAEFRAVFREHQTDLSKASFRIA